MGSARRSILLLGLAAGMVVVGAASAALQPIRRPSGELTVPRLRAGTLTIPKAHTRGRIRVIVRLGLPPLAAYARDFQASGAARRLNVASASSRAYVARLGQAQSIAAAQLTRAIPRAVIQERFRILLNGLTVDLPARALPKLANLRFVTRIFPSVRYSLATNRSPGVMGADQLWANAGVRGEGMKIGVVDDGVDQTNPYFDPSGFSFPSGFPKGVTRFTTPKVIAARAFPAPGAGKQAALPLYRPASFHGTHVAGIAAGDAGTTAPAGIDHPRTTGLSGVAPRAQIGSYRVFSRPTPVGFDAFTPEIVAAFEAAVRDGMDVINFSGGGPQIDPVNDGLVEAVDNVAAAGVVPVISAGNDRDEFGFGSVGTPGIAPAAISVAAVSNSHTFAAALTVTSSSAPPELKQVPFFGAGGQNPPAAWGASDQTLVDVGTIVGTDGRPVDRQLCGSGVRVNDPRSTTLPAGSLQGAIALVFRGACTFDSKARRAQAAGAIGLILVNNRAGESGPIPVVLLIPSGMVADLDGVRLRDYLDSVGGRAPIRVGQDPLEIQNNRPGIVTYFSSAGPTDFGHDIKPDVAAPGGQILSATLPEFARTPFAVFDGTSMSAPHVTGGATLLLQLHPGWSPEQVKSALVSTAGPAWADTARTQEAPVQLEGGGLVNLPRASDPKLFTEPVSLSFDDLNVNRGARRQSLLVTLDDAGDGGGTWAVELRPQSASAGAMVDVPPAIVVPPGGEAQLPVTARASADAAKGDDFGFIVLRRGDVTRRIPYLFSVTRPGLEFAPQAKLQKLQLGDTIVGGSKVTDYRYPAGPYAPAFSSLSSPTHEDGAEKLYVTHLDRAAVNLGVSVLAQTGGVIDPFLLGSPDENDVQGYAATPFGVNIFVFDNLFPVEAAAVDFPRQKAYYVAVDSPRDTFTGELLTGRYLLNSWVNDVTPPRLKILTKTVAAGHPTLAARATDGGSGVDPFSLVIAYRNVLLGAAVYDPFSGIVLFPMPRQAPTIRLGKTRAIGLAYDYQETKNVDQAGDNVLPNTTFVPVTFRGVKRPTVSWIFPSAGQCAARSERLLVVANATKRIRTVRFYDGARRIATVRRGTVGLYATTWRTRGLRKGKHRLTAFARDASGRTARAVRIVRVCRK